MATKYEVFWNHSGNIFKIYGYSDEVIKLMELGRDFTRFKKYI